MVVCVGPGDNRIVQAQRIYSCCCQVPTGRSGTGEADHDTSNRPFTTKTQHQKCFGSRPRLVLSPCRTISW